MQKVAELRKNLESGRQMATAAAEQHSRADHLLAAALQQQGATRRRVDSLADLVEGFGGKLEEVAQAQALSEEELAAVLGQLESAQGKIVGLEEERERYLAENAGLREEVVSLAARNAGLVAAKEVALDAFRMDKSFKRAGE